MDAGVDIVEAVMVLVMLWSLRMKRCLSELATMPPSLQSTLANI
jgi:hypothetical protein